MGKAEFKTSRRNFFKYAIGTVASLAVGTLPSGCAMYYIPSPMRKVTKGFNVYNGFNPHIGYRRYQTFLHNINEHKVAWAGTQYSKDLSEPIIAPARGKIIWVKTTRGYHGLEDSVRIAHGWRLTTRHFHMKPNTSRNQKVQVGNIVERGDVIGHTYIGMPYKTKMLFDMNMGDMDDYGHRMRYMKPWDAASAMDHDFIDVKKRIEIQMALIDQLRLKYIGPGKKEMSNPYRGIPDVYSYDGKGEFLWTHSVFFKMLEHIYQNHPELYKGTKNDNDQLIKDIYDNQPVELTLPFKI